MSKPTNIAVRDFGTDGIDIQTAMLRHVLNHPDPATRTKYILWNGATVWTTFEIAVPARGRFRLEFVSDPREPPQGVDVKIEGGEITLRGGETVQTLRTWHESRFEAAVEYPFISKAGLIKVWNVYHRRWPDGRLTEEKWTGNAGFLVAEEAESSWIFRCSNGASKAPDFTQMVFRITIYED